MGSWFSNLHIRRAENIEMGELLHSLFGHAVHAAEITAVRQRYTQVIDYAAMAVLHIPLLQVHSQLPSILQEGKTPRNCGRSATI